MWQTRRWKKIRAALIAVHLLAIGIMALPSPGAGLQKSAWKDPTVQQEFGIWRTRLTYLGVELAPAEFEELLWTLATGFQETRNYVIAPFDPYYRYFGTWQSWRMFVAPHRFPARLEIDIDNGDGDWRPIYQARSPEYNWNQAQFDHERFRAAIFRYSWPAYRRTWKQFAQWSAARVMDDYPDVVSVRLRFFKYRTPSPEEVLGGAEVHGKYINTRIYKREDL